MENDFAHIKVEWYVETTKGHGREDTVEYFHLPVPDTLPGASLWKNLKTIGVAVRTSLQGAKEIPLYNNLSENDIRQYVKKRKISAGTRSDLGRRCRDTFLSLKTTCRKLGLTFWRYLQDRIQDLHEVHPLEDLIRQKAKAANA